MHTLLDKQLRVRKFTPRTGETFNLVPHDIGRPIGVQHTSARLRRWKTFDGSYRTAPV